MTTQRNEKWVLRVPKDSKGEGFIKLFKQYLNKDTYKMSKQYTGPRPKGTSPYSTKEENATSTRLYINKKYPEKQKPYWSKVGQWMSSTNARPNTHMAGSIYPIPSMSKPVKDGQDKKEVKQEAHSTISKSRLTENIEALKYRIEDLKYLSDKHRELNGKLRVEANDLYEIAMDMFTILEQVDFSSTGTNTCYDDVPWNKIEKILHKYKK